MLSVVVFSVIKRCKGVFVANFRFYATKIVTQAKFFYKHIQMCTKAVKKGKTLHTKQGKTKLKR